MGGGSKAAAVYHRYGHRNGFLLHPGQRRGSKADCLVHIPHRLHHPGVDGHGADNAGIPTSSCLIQVTTFLLRLPSAWSSIVLPASSRTKYSRHPREGGRAIASGTLCFEPALLIPACAGKTITGDFGRPNAIALPEVRLIFDIAAGQAIIVRRRLIAGLPGGPALRLRPVDAPFRRTRLANADKRSWLCRHGKWPSWPSPTSAPR